MKFIKSMWKWSILLQMTSSMKCIKRVPQPTHTAVVLGSYRILLLQQFPLKAYGRNYHIHLYFNFPEQLIGWSTRKTYNSRLGLHCNMAELHYRYEQSKATERQDGEQLGRQEAQCHSGVARWCCLSQQWPAELIKQCCWCTAKEAL